MSLMTFDGCCLIAPLHMRTGKAFDGGGYRIWDIGNRLVVNIKKICMEDSRQASEPHRHCKYLINAKI